MERQEKIQILKDIVSIDSTNGNEEAVADYLAAVLSRHGIQSQKVMFAEKRANLISRIGNPNGRVLGFSGHMDVVDAGNLADWDTPPFEGTERNDQLYGRGATDMKSGLAALIIAMIELAEEKISLDGEIKLLATVGEEVGELGAKQLTDEGYADNLDGLIIGEPSGHNIVYAHKGSMNYKIVSFGKNAHSSTPEFGINAIDNLMLCYRAIESYVHSIQKENAILGKFIHNVTIIEGGNQVNSIPEQAYMQGNIRTIPEVSNEEVKQKFAEIVEQLNGQEQVQLELKWDYDKQPVFSEADSELVQVAQDVAQELIGKKMPLLGISGTTDAAEFTKSKKEFATIIFGPGNETPHQVNEYVSIANYLEMIDVYKQIAIRFLNEKK
ncbi:MULTISPECIES: ArgE/DapE family deacylase [Listeria]|uniref:ArgE/DapE family deacylase n=1 Tax=Listeria TaxID=1637 RepID=UPI000B58E310|nr:MULTISPECIES: ArgE/DapE family deacylase [Listeria]